MGGNYDGFVTPLGIMDVIYLKLQERRVSEPVCVVLRDIVCDIV